jgi:hypothetical protein
MKVPAQATRVTAEEMIRTLAAVWQVEFGDVPKQATVALLLAQWALETGRGKSMMNYNVGNIKAPDPLARHAYFRTWEVLPLSVAAKYLKSSTPEEPCKLVNTEPDGKVASVAFLPDHPVCRFRAYASLEEGVQDYLVKLKGRFKRAWPALLAGDPLTFVTALKAAGYMTADVKEYYRSVNSLFAEYLALIKAGDMPETIEQIQAALTQLGYNPGPLDGDLGPRTQGAVKEFQADMGLKVDGNPGPITKAALQHELFRRKIQERTNA